MPEIPSRYYAYTKKSIRGPFAPRDIAQLPGFSKNTLVCPENALGQWREAALENVFQSCFDAFPGCGAPVNPVREQTLTVIDGGIMPPSARNNLHRQQEPTAFSAVDSATGQRQAGVSNGVKPKPPLNAAQAEGIAFRSLLEKGIAKNAALENEVRTLRREYNQEKKRFEEDTRKKDSEIKNLADKLRRSNEAARAVTTEHPSWETLYKTLKKRSGEKLFEATQALSEKTGEIIRLKNQMQSMVDNYETYKRKNSDDEAQQMSAIKEQLNDLKSQLEEKEMAVLTINDNISSLLRKNEEFQRIMLDERHDYEGQSKKFCEEIGTLKSELNWKNQETEKIRGELAETLNRLKEFEAVENIKTREQEELYGVLHSKIKILAGYFENLESRVKYIFKKA